jgi:hypothetical protein
MKVIIDLDDDKREFVIKFLKKNDLAFEFEYDFDVPQWQIDEVEKRRKDSLANPATLLTLEELKAKLVKS